MCPCAHPGGVDHALCREPISATPHCFDNGLVPCRLKHGAQSLDMDVDGTLFDEGMVAPYLIEQHGAAMHPLGVGQEEMQ